jgi:hypothetical protein
VRSGNACCHQRGILERGAGPHAKPPFDRAGLRGSKSAPGGGLPVAEETLARKRLVHQAVDGMAIALQPDQRAP